MRASYAVTGGCALCGMCALDCPAGAIAITNDGALIDRERCRGCGACRENCSWEAIEKIEAEPVKTK